MPFSITSKEATEIRNVSNLLFYGSDPTSQPETRDLYFKWKTFFDVFVMCRDARYGNMIHLPFNCSAFEQPAKTWNVIEYIQNEYQKKLIKDAKNIK